MLLAFGVLCALTDARTSGHGQVVDAAMTDGASLLMAMMYTFKAMGQWSNERGTNLLDGGAHFSARSSAPTASGFRSAPSSPSSMRCCWKSADSTIRRSRPSWTAADGRH